LQELRQVKGNEICADCSTKKSRMGVA